MARRILRYDGDPVLKKESKEIKKITNKVKRLAEDLVDTLECYPGVGLSAPQIGALKRIIVVNFPEEDSEFKELFENGPIVAINPEILESEGEITDTEACLSFPDMFGQVSRPQKVTVKFLNLDGEEVIQEYPDMVARCFCHEIDHLNGIVFLDRVIDGTLNTIVEDKEQTQDDATQED